MRAAICAWGVALGLGLGAVAAQPVGDYEGCLALAARDPAAAETAALAWAGAGGGAAAAHCRALALGALGARGRAAVALGELATDRSLPDATRAEILVQAGEFHLADGNPDAALDAATQALRLGGGAVALTLRARLRAGTGDLAGAEADLSAALTAAPPQAERLALRASARRRQGNLIGAQDDALWALSLDPGAATAWLERGQAEAALGRPDEARVSLLEAIARDQDGAVRPLAQLALQKMEAGID